MRPTKILTLLIAAGMALNASAQRKKKPVQKKKAATHAKAKKSRKQTTLHRNSAKDTLLKGATIEIIQSYKPEVKNTPKPEFATNLPPADTTTPTLDYSVPQQSLSYTYSSFPLRPLALGADSAGTTYENYVKLGGGNLSTLYLDAGIGGLNGLTYETNLHLKHFSQAGNIEYQKSSLTGLEANGTLHRNGKAWHGNIEALRNQFYQYGYNHDIFTYPVDAVRKTYYGVRAGADMKNEEEGFRGINYHPSFDISVYGTQATPAFGATERTIRANVPATYEIDTTLSVYMGINTALTQFNDALTGQSNNILQFTPGIHFVKGGTKGHAGLYPTIGKNGTSYILPDIEAKFGLHGTQLAFVAGWQSQLRQNTFEQLSTRNPYMWDSYTVKQTRTDEIFGGLQSNIGNHISFGGRISWWQYKNMPLFVNDTIADEKRFAVVYDKVTAISLQAFVRYEIANTFSLGFSGSWYNYSTKLFDKPWHEPGVQLKGDLAVKPLKDLTVTGYMSIMDGIYALGKGNKTEKLDAFMDVGAGAEYNFITRLSGFVQVNNLLNNKYERWKGYQVYGFNIYGGIRLKF